ncbi:MAG: MBL fold metallo-hydrolase [Rhodospirillaceae bacterium]|jgi:alkyl sulfatase BDS1-like metallo-beta-lactamase superfamily hydrolase|nr:MBL fold metallo-hydrolase [Rhodospirillaceae bacterium]
MSPNEIKPSVHPELAAQMTLYETPRIITTLGHIHTAHCYTGSNCTLIEGEDGAVLVDTLSGEIPGNEVAAAFKEITDKPIKAVIVTHFHGDHVSGIFSFVSEDDIRAGKVEVIGQAHLTENLLRDEGILAPIRRRRGPYQFGGHLEYGVEGGYGSALGAPPRRGKSGFVNPTRTFDDRLELEIAGVRIEVVHVPSETDDQSVVWLPDEKVLISADAIQGMTFPNVYALRGTQFRNPMQWAKGLDCLRDFKADILIPHHGPTVEGAGAVEDVLVAHRDAIQYLHDQAVRWINKGCTWDELAEKVTMPEHLASHPWLGEFYGSFKHSVRSVYTGYVGWFQGDAVELDPVPWRERATRYVRMMGGRDAILAEARQAIHDEDFRWAADIATWLVRADNSDQEARDVKATALRGWGYRQKTSTWRNWALCQALELENALGEPRGGHGIQPNQARNYPTGGLLELMTVRLIADEAFDTHLTLGFVVTDTGEDCGLEIRRGVCQFHPSLPESRDATLSFPREFLSIWAGGVTSFDDGIESGDVLLAGDRSVVTEFFEKFEPAEGAGPFGMSVR